MTPSGFDDHAFRGEHRDFPPSSPRARRIAPHGKMGATRRSESTIDGERHRARNMSGDGVNPELRGRDE